MRLSLLKAKEYLKPKAPVDKLEWRINRLHERLLLHGKFQGAIVRLALIARYGQLTPPRFVKAIEGIKFCDGHVPQIANRWFDFMPRRCNVTQFCTDLMRDLGDGHPILYDLPAEGTLRSDVTAGSPVMTVSGYTADFLPLDVNFTGDQSGANGFAGGITRVHKQQKTVPMRLTHVADDLTETPLVIMGRNEEETYYHRYRIDGRSTTEETTVEALCKLRHIEFTDEQDLLWISNLSALELGMDALQFEAENDHATADRYLLKCVDLLNRDLADSNSDNDIPTIRFQYVGGAPNLHFGY